MNKWTTTRLGDVCNIVSGATPKTNDPSLWGGDIHWATPKDLSDRPGKFINETDRTITEKGLRSCAASIIPAGSVLLSSRAPIGLVAINTVPMATNQGFKSLVPDSRYLDASYLYRWLVSNTTLLQNLGRGATFIEISKSITADIRIPLPPLEEQRRIAAILDHVDGLLQLRRISQSTLHSLVSSSFTTLFQTGRIPAVTARLDDIKHPNGWPWELLTDVAELATGHTPDRARPDYWNGGIPWISLTEIRKLDGKIANETELNVSAEGIKHSSSVILPPGTVCLSRTASIGFVTIMGREMSTSQDFVNWICGERLDPVYLLHALLVSRRHLRALSTGSTHKTIYMRVAEKFRVLVPPIEVQLEFRRQVERAHALQSSYDRSHKGLASLSASLQQRAFAGEL